MANEAVCNITEGGLLPEGGKINPRGYIAYCRDAMG